MSLDNTVQHELSKLAVSYACGFASDEEFARLAELLRTNDEALNYYVDSLDTHANLYWHHRKSEDGPDDQQQFADWTAAAALAAAACTSLEDKPLFEAPLVPIVANVVSAPLHGTLATTYSGWLVAYLIATLIVGIGLTVAAVMHVSSPVQVVNQPIRSMDANSQSSIPNLAPKAEAIGRITGVVDCQWAAVSENKPYSPAFGRGAGGGAA